MRASIRGVPCQSCSNGYDTLHLCDSPDYCGCDRTRLHTNAATIPCGCYTVIGPLRAEVKGWEDWSNELASVLPEDAETWPGANPDAAQEAIIVAALQHLLKSREKLIQMAKDFQDEEDALPWAGEKIAEALGVDLG